MLLHFHLVYNEVPPTVITCNCLENTFCKTINKDRKNYAWLYKLLGTPSIWLYPHFVAVAVTGAQTSLSLASCSNFPRIDEDQLGHIIHLSIPGLTRDHQHTLFTVDHLKNQLNWSYKIGVESVLTCTYPRWVVCFVLFEEQDRPLCTGSSFHLPPSVKTQMSWVLTKVRRDSLLLFNSFFR